MHAEFVCFVNFAVNYFETNSDVNFAENCSESEVRTALTKQ